MLLPILLSLFRYFNFLKNYISLLLHVSQRIHQFINWLCSRWLCLVLKPYSANGSYQSFDKTQTKYHWLLTKLSFRKCSSYTQNLISKNWLYTLFISLKCQTGWPHWIPLLPQTTLTTNPQNVPVKCLFKLSMYLGDIYKNQRLCQLKTVPPTNFEMVVCSRLFILGVFSPSTSTV